MKTTPSPDTDAEVAPVADPTHVVVGVDSENTSSPTTEDYVDALQDPPVEDSIEKQTLPEELGKSLASISLVWQN